jgi:hypothetical protein
MENATFEIDGRPICYKYFFHTNFLFKSLSLNYDV